MPADESGRDRQSENEDSHRAVDVWCRWCFVAELIRKTGPHTMSSVGNTDQSGISYASLAERHSNATLRCFDSLARQKHWQSVLGEVNV